MTSAGLFILSATFLYDEKDSLAWVKVNILNIFLFKK